MRHIIVFNWKREGVGILVYLFLLGASIFYNPMHLFLCMIPPVVVVWLLIQRTPVWMKCIVAGWLLIAGIYVLFNNDIVGPMMFMINDAFFDIPAHYFHSWRFFWIMNYLCQLSWTWGMPSVLFLLWYKTFYECPPDE